MDLIEKIKSNHYLLHLLGASFYVIEGYKINSIASISEIEGPASVQWLSIVNQTVATIVLGNYGRINLSHGLEIRTRKL